MYYIFLSNTYLSLDSDNIQHARVSQLYNHIIIYKTVGFLPIVRFDTPHVPATHTFCCYKEFNMSHVMRKPAFCICENKDADQLRSNRQADQRLCFRYIDSTIPLLHVYKISSLKPSCVTVQPSLCQTWSETPKTGFLSSRLICEHLPSRDQKKR